MISDATWMARVSRICWSKTKIASVGEGYNLVLTKAMLDFDGTISEDGNVCLYDYERSGRFHYLIGIDKRSRDIFYHLWEKKRARRDFDLGDYIEERGEDPSQRLS